MKRKAKEGNNNRRITSSHLVNMEYIHHNQLPLNSSNTKNHLTTAIISANIGITITRCLLCMINKLFLTCNHWQILKSSCNVIICNIRPIQLTKLDKMAWNLNLSSFLHKSGSLIMQNMSNTTTKLLRLLRTVKICNMKVSWCPKLEKMAKN